MTTVGRRPGRPPSLTREEVARAALSAGFDGLSMPAVAKLLGVSHSTLYRYVRDRTDLVYAAMEIVVEEHGWPSATLEWRPMLVAFADGLWAMLDRHPGMAEAVYGMTSMPERVVGLLTEYARSLRAAGFSSRESIVALDFIVDLTMSTAIAMRALDAAEDTPDGPRTRRELHRASLRGLSPELDEDATWAGRGWFDDKLAIMLDGLELRLSR